MAKEKPVERRDLAAEANKKIGILARIGQVWFAICLVTALLATWLFVTLTTIRFSFWDGLNPSGIVVRYCTRFAILMFHATLWIAVKLNPQIQVKCEGFDKWEQLIADPARPICILANHLSFMDMICGCAFVPWFVVWDTKTLFKSTLYKLPIFGAIAKACRHIPVYFKADVSGKFSTDDSKKAITHKRVNDTLANSQHLIMFPEGTMNRGDITKLQPFRYGTFRALVSHNATLWGFAIQGTEKCWPINARDGNNSGNIGGLPCSITLRLFPLAANGCTELIGGPTKVARDPSSSIFQHQVELVANNTRDLFQKEIDTMLKTTIE